MTGNRDYKALSLNIIKSRFAQLIINERLKLKLFRIPVHLALGHESIAEALSSAMFEDDKLLCSHRNIHYQFARGAKLIDILEEFNLSKAGLATGKGGSMNLANPAGSIVYTSSILGNDLCVASGVALAKRIRQETGVVFVVTGDGAMEEGAFFETMENARSLDLPLIILVENNNWSLASCIEERRKPINLRQLATSMGVGYSLLEGNNPMAYRDFLTKTRERVCLQKRPEVVEVKLTTLGNWRIPTEEFPEGRFINYHAGAAPKVSLSGGPILIFDATDPVFLISETLGETEFSRQVSTTQHLFSAFLTS
jgi:pyruvate dehydrogenase E1 component alpha subunit